jgi:inosine-uridine nucleoside N-ribohydrolase
MEKSYDEILRLLELLERPDAEEFALRGAERYMDDVAGPVENPATADLIRRARDRDDDPLYVVSIGAPTNVASAIKREPTVVENIVVVWLGGQPLYWHTAEEFNLQQDLLASRTLFESGVPLVQVPCKNVAEHVRTTVPELETYLSGGGELSEYLLEIFTDHRQHYHDRQVWAKEIWDVAPIAYLLEHEWVPTNLVHSPRLSDDLRYGHDTSQHFIRVAMDARRDYIFDDFFEKLGGR